MIKFNSVTKRFGDGTLVFNDLTFDIDQGEMILVTGPSGSGKTTLMKLLIRQALPTQGEIYFEDNPIIELKHSDIPFYRRKIGVVFQDYKLLEEFNVWENIALPLYIAGKSQSEIENRVTDILNLIGLPDRAFSFPKQLSGGEAQRVGIGRALVTAPKVIFADEPTGNLDREITHAIVSLLRKINKLGTTVLVATHDQNVLDLLEDLRRVELKRSREPVETQDEVEEAKKKEVKKVKIKVDDETKDGEVKEDELEDEKAENESEEKDEKEKEVTEDTKDKKSKKKTRFSIDLPFLRKKKKIKEENNVSNKQIGETKDSNDEKKKLAKTQKMKKHRRKNESI